MDIDKLFNECREEIKKAGIPLNENTEGIQINSRAVKRFGCCKRTEGSDGRDLYTIEISSHITGCGEKLIKEVICHELLHTCEGCFNHGKKWKKYAEELNRLYGYDISRTASPEKTGTEEPEEAGSFKYELVCTKCGAVIKRKRRSKLTEHPEFYRCGKCGGRLKKCEKSTISCR